MIDVRLKLPSGRNVRLRRRQIPTRQLAEQIIAKARTEAFENRYLDRQQQTFTVRQAWEFYEPTTRDQNSSWQSDIDRASHLVEHLGDVRVIDLTESDLDEYRRKRKRERTRRGAPPSPATLDREVELLKRFLNYAARCNKVPSNPVANVSLLRQPNIRRSW